MFVQLNPSIPLDTPKGSALAIAVIDQGIEHHLIWVCIIDATNEVWSFENPFVRGTKNITMGRLKDNKGLHNDD